MLTRPRLPLTGCLGSLALAALVGCGGPTHHRGHAQYGYGVSGWEQSAHSHRWQPAQPEAPTLALDQAQVDEAMSALAARREARAQTFTLAAGAEGLVSADRPAVLPSLPVDLAAREVSAAWAMAQRDQAEAITAAHPGLLELDEASAAGAVIVACEYVTTGRGGVMELTLVRGVADGPLAVCVPPGTYGVPVMGDLGDRRGSDESPWVEPRDHRRYRNWPSPQDLALLQARVVLLEEGQTMAQVHLPVACASFSKSCPQGGQEYQLQRYPRDSQADRLLVALCAGELEAGEAEVQLALWMAQNDLSWDEFVAEGGHYGRLVTFGRAQAVLPEHAAGAARILLDSGVDPRGCAFFGGRGGPLSAETVTVEVDQPQVDQVQPEPAPEPAPATAEAVTKEELEG